MFFFIAAATTTTENIKYLATHTIHFNKNHHKKKKNKTKNIDNLTN